MSPEPTFFVVVVCCLFFFQIEPGSINFTFQSCFPKSLENSQVLPILLYQWKMYREKAKGYSCPRTISGRFVP